MISRDLTLAAVAIAATAAVAVVAVSSQATAEHSGVHGNAAVGEEAPIGAVAPTYPGGQIRTYYVAADQVAWDYAPRRRDVITGKRFGPVEDVFVRRGPGRVGSTYLKSLYRQYTDDTFKQRTPVVPEWRHLGFLGPAIEAEVGDTIVVHFRNNTPFPTGMHPHGVRYAKDSEGAPYNDGTAGDDKADDAVGPGRTHTYVWQVPERSGPGPGDPSSVMWMYHGHTDEVADSYAGLVGPIVITRKGIARPDGSPSDVDRQFVALFEVVDENKSPFLAANVRRYALRQRARGRRPSAKRLGRELRELRESEEFSESNLMHSINGYVYGNGPLFEMKRGERARWYVMGMGTEVDLHSPHWHGNVLMTSMGMRTDAAMLEPGAMFQADMEPDDAGVWLFHCHVNDHITAGMLARYKVG